VRSLRIDLSGLAEAFASGNAEAAFYLDLETGAVLLVTEETRRDLEELRTVLDDESATSPADLAAALEDSGLPAWQIETVLEAYQVEAGSGERYLGVPPVDSRQAYRDMEAFIATVPNATLRERLRRAIQGRGAFRQFKNVLNERPQEEQRWFAFRDGRTQQRMLEWLEAEGIEAM